MSFKPNKIHSLKRAAIVILAGSVISCCVLVFVSGALSSKDIAPVVSVTGTPARAFEHQQKRTSLVESEMITVTSNGFEPKTITRPEGEFILMIENPQSQELNLELSREHGANVNRVRASRAEPDWNELQDLRPGRYVLTEASHPEWMCLITITAR